MAIVPQFRKATRVQCKLSCAIEGLSGSGKARAADLPRQSPQSRLYGREYGYGGLCIVQPDRCSLYISGGFSGGFDAPSAGDG